MAYDKQVWVNGPDGQTPLKDLRLNHVEDGLLAVSNLLDQLVDAVNALIVGKSPVAAAMIAGGTTAGRPVPALDAIYRDHDLGSVIYGTGTAWVYEDGTPVGGTGGSNAPLNFTAVTQPDNSILCSWNAVANATSYKLYETQSSGGVSGATALTATTTTRTPGTLRTYDYWVTALVSGVESAGSNHGSATLPYTAASGTGGGGGGTGTLGVDSIYWTYFEEMTYEITSTAENSRKDWYSTAVYGYIEDIGDNRGYTAGIVGFCSGTGDMLAMIQHYVAIKPTSNAMATYVSALTTLAAEGMSSSAGTRANSLLGTTFKNLWASLATSDALFRQAQRDYREDHYWRPAFNAAVADGVQGLGLEILYDISINHGEGTDPESFGGILATARAAARPPSLGGSEVTYLTALINARSAVLTTWGDNPPDGRVAAHRALLATGNLKLTVPFSWSMYGTSFSISAPRPDLPAEAARTGGVQPGASVPVGPGSPAQLLHFGSTGGFFNVGIGYSSGHVDRTYAEIMAGGTWPPYFMLNAAGTAVQFLVYMDGAKTSANTNYPRSELRELGHDGVTKAAWVASSGSHVMEYSFRVNHVQPKKPWVTVGQIHDASQDNLGIKIKGSTVGSLSIIASINGTDNATPVLSSYTIGQAVKIKIAVINGSLTIYANDTLKITSSALSSQGAGHYFKLGSYAQSSTTYGGFDAATEYSSVDIWGLTVTHSPAL